MMFDDVKDKVIKLWENNGVIIEDSEPDTDLRDYAIDSLIFISFILDIENEFSIVVPDNFLTIEVLQSINGFVNLLIEIINARG